jgi:hypothetical protein
MNERRPPTGSPLAADLLRAPKPAAAVPSETEVAVREQIAA